MRRRNFEPRHGRWRRPRIDDRTRFDVLRRDGFRCRWCGAPARDCRLTIDHIVPLSRGGDNTDENLCAACERCNMGRGNRYVEPPPPGRGAP